MPDEQSKKPQQSPQPQLEDQAHQTGHGHEKGREDQIPDAQFDDGVHGRTCPGR